MIEKGRTSFELPFATMSFIQLRIFLKHCIGKQRHMIQYSVDMTNLCCVVMVSKCFWTELLHRNNKYGF